MAGAGGMQKQGNQSKPSAKDASLLGGDIKRKL